MQTFKFSFVFQFFIYLLFIYKFCTNFGAESEDGIGFISK